MSEIERAIETLEDEVRILYGHGNLVDKDTIDAHEIALKLLRAELEREKNPMTCDGCRREEIYKELDGEDKILITCLKCERSKKTDRYEPKGEKA